MYIAFLHLLHVMLIGISECLGGISPKNTLIFFPFFSFKGLPGVDGREGIPGMPGAKVGHSWHISELW